MALCREAPDQGRFTCGSNCDGAEAGKRLLPAFFANFCTVEPYRRAGFEQNEPFCSSGDEPVKPNAKHGISVWKKVTAFSLASRAE